MAFGTASIRLDAAGVAEHVQVDDALGGTWTPDCARLQPAPLARGLFCLSRSVGILSHAWEQTGQGGRNKGPIPREYLWTYEGPEPRAVP